MQKPQQTIERAIDTESGRPYEAAELLAMSEQEFSDLRRLAMTNRVARQKENASPRFVCAICRRPLYLSRYVREQGNRWFAHDGRSPDCPWYEGNKLSPEIRRALIYRGEQEGLEHLRIKQFLTRWLEFERGVSDVNPEQVTHGQILKGEWKRPDVQCVLGGRRIVFEIQLSYTFLSDVIRRDNFYKQEGIFIIWVFNDIDMRRAVVQDEMFFNRRNLFAIDAKAFEATELSRRLTFHGHFHRPVLIDGCIEDVWESRLVTLDNVRFPTPSYRPYFFDYDSEKQGLQEVLAEKERKALQEKRDNELSRYQQDQITFQQGIQLYLSAALAFYDSDYGESIRGPLLDIAANLRGSRFWCKEYSALSDPRFFDWHGILPVLLSIKYDRAVGYKVDTAYRVLEAGVRKEKYRLAVLFLWACKAYRPTLTDVQRTWVRSLSAKIKGSLEMGEATYLRLTTYDKAIALLFPELRAKVGSSYAIGI